MNPHPSILLPLSLVIFGCQALPTPREEMGEPLTTTQPEPMASAVHGFTNFLGMRFERIPAGRFVMGSEVGRREERPPFAVELNTAFFMSATEVTETQYYMVMNFGPDPDYWHDLPLPAEGKPAHLLSYHEAIEFCERLTWLERALVGEAEGGPYMLPTEAQWEYACRAGSQTEYCFGDEEERLGEFAWYEENSGGKRHPVGTKRPNAWGLHDMHGNVREWCRDYYHPEIYRKLAVFALDGPVSYPTGPGEDYGGHSCFGGLGGRVVRGGGAHSDASWLRSSSRMGCEESSKGYGIRVITVRYLR